MSLQPQPSAREEEIRRALRRMVSGGHESLWLPEVQPLLELPAVKERAKAGRRGTAKALRAVLLEAIEELGQSQYRNLLEIVLGLTRESADLSASRRRALAGEKFREGERPVTAGTIRQHHEQRAIAELAKRLVSRFGEGGGARPQVQEWTEWHPSVREAWAKQRLNLWRISISDYDPREVSQVLEALMREQKVAAWAVHEMFGIFDLLLEAWLPPDVWAPIFERALGEAFKDRLIRCDPFAVDEVLTHWVWRRGEDVEMRLPPARVLAKPPPERRLAGLRAGNEKQLTRYINEDVAARVVAEPGIGFLVAITGLWGHPLLSRAEQERVKDLILRTLANPEEASFSQIVLLRGSGFAEYLLQGRVRPESFYQLKGLVSSLDDSLRVSGMRTHTFVLADGGPLIRKEGLVWDLSSEAQRSAKDLLQEGESPVLEVRSSAFADLLPDDRIGSTWAASTAGKGLMRTVAAMLNSDGGAIVLGASPHSRAMEDPRFTGRRREGAPVIGEYVVIGIDDEIAGKPDRYLRRVNQMCSRMIDPDPLPYLDLRLERVEDRTVLVIAISGPPDEWFYFAGDSKNDFAFVIRDNAGSTRRLSGREADAYKQQSSRS